MSKLTPDWTATISSQLETALTAAENKNPLAPSLIWQELRQILDPALDGVKSEILTRVHGALLRNLSMSDQRASPRDLELVRHAPKIFPVLQPHNAFWHRYAADHPREKAVLARYVARHFVKDGLRCFVQASTTAIHLGQSIATNRAKSTLFYTNSVVFPITVLRSGSFHSVFPFAGSTFDEMCGGWLFPLGDHDTANELRRLFTRPNAALTTTFLMPMVTQVDHGLYFPRRETALLASILLTMPQEVVILSTADRLYGANDELPHPDLPLESVGDVNWQRGKKVSLVVCGERQGREKELIDGFRANGFDVQWLDVDAPVGAEDFPDLNASEVGERGGETPSERNLRMLFEAAGKVVAEGTDDEFVEELRTFLGRVCELQELFKAFRASSGNISGPNGVAELLKGLSRNAIYCKLGRFNLNPEDFLDPKVSLFDLIEKSDTLKVTAGRLLLASAIPNS